MVTRDTPRLREIKQFLIDFFWKTYYARFGSANPRLRSPDHPLIPASVVHYVNYVIVEFCGCKILIVFGSSNFPMTPNARLLVGWSVCPNFLKGHGKLHFHAPIGALVYI